MNLKIREMRIAAGLTQEQVANKAGVDRGYYALVETGKRTPSFGAAKALSSVFGIEIDPENLFGKVEANEQNKEANSGETS